MLNAINNFIMMIADPLLGWLLYFPQDVALLLIALLTGLILTWVRLFTTDQQYLERCKKDKVRLKELMREAKQASDKKAMMRYRRTMGQIGMKGMAAEGMPLLASIIPIAILAVWAFSRIAYIAPQENESITMKMYFPLAEVGSYVHILPVDGVEAENGWIQKVEDDMTPPGPVELDENGEPIVDDSFTVINGVAKWTFKPEMRDDPYKLVIRHGDRTFEKELIFDGTRYSEPFTPYGPLFEEVIEFKAKEYKLFGIIPGIPSIMLAPWMMGYLIIVLPLAFILKPVLRIH